MITRATIVALAATIAAGGVAQAAVTLTRDAAIGARYGTPGPRRCSTTTEPRQGAISSEQARDYVICGHEVESNGLDLFGHVQVQVSRARPYEHVRDSLQDIDPRRPVFDIRGASLVFSCLDPRQMPSSLTRAQQCTRTQWNSAEGKCYQTTFGDWRCTWSDFNAPMSTDTRLRVGAPSLADVQ